MREMVEDRVICSAFFPGIEGEFLKIRDGEEIIIVLQKVGGEAVKRGKL